MFQETFRTSYGNTLPEVRFFDIFSHENVLKMRSDHDKLLILNELNLIKGRKLANPEKSFKEGCKSAGLEWVGFHDLRRFRATQWLRLGLDVRSVKDILGHSDVQTTMPYALSVPQHTVTRVRQLESSELEEIGEEERVRFG